MIGILGGSFDPIHFGHLRTALDVQQALDLTEILLIPLRDPPHRESLSADADQRLAMARTAVADNPLFRIDPRELERPGKSFTVDTLRSLRLERQEETLCLLLGSDAFRGFPEWHQPDEILQLAHLVVMQRPGERQPDLYPERIVNRPAALRDTPAGGILFQEVTQLDISATHIRALLKSGKDPRYLLPQTVLSIIRRQRLYQ